VKDDPAEKLKSALAHEQQAIERLRRAQREVNRIQFEIAKTRGELLGFTARERDVVNLLMCRRSNKEIAVILGIEVRTAKFHVSSILKKFGCQSRIELWEGKQ
jgi:DNA-binding NarL/FixJ family response regulator